MADTCDDFTYCNRLSITNQPYQFTSITVPTILGVSVPKINKAQLLDRLEQELKPNSRLSLYFLYSEFVLRANRFPAYREILNRASIVCIDGRGLMWGLWSLIQDNGLGFCYGALASWTYSLQLKVASWAVSNSNRILKVGVKLILGTVSILRIVLFLACFSLNLIWNLMAMTIAIAGKLRFERLTETEVILGRDFVWDLLQLAADRQFKVSIVGGSQEGDQITRELVTTCFPGIKLSTWIKPQGSNLITDIPRSGELLAEKNAISNELYTPKTQAAVLPWVLKLLAKVLNLAMPTYGQNISSDNVCYYYPDLYSAKEFIKLEKPDIVLLCLGGGSGKQEYFADHLRSDNSVEFGLVTGLGAAIDYLDGGKKKPPRTAERMGLEWIFRLIHQPYRRLRIIDAIFSLWWWVSLEQLTDYLTYRPTAVAVVSNADDEYLLVKRNAILPGDMGWTFVQGGIDPGEQVGAAAMREVQEETGLEIEKLKVGEVEQDYTEEAYSLSLIRCVALGGVFQGSQSQIVRIKYTGNQQPQTNYENMAGGWFPKNEAFGLLSPEKRPYFR